MNINLILIVICSLSLKPGHYCTAADQFLSKQNDDDVQISIDIFIICLPVKSHHRETTVRVRPCLAAC